MKLFIRTIMKKIILYTVSAFVLASCSGAMLKDFRSLPDGMDPVTIGNRVAEQFLSTDPMAYAPEGYDGKKPVGQGKYLHYSVTSLWVNALEFSRHSGNKSLEEKLISHFEPFFGERKDSCNRSNHVDFTIFGSVPLEIYLTSGDRRALDLGLHYADRQWEAPDSTSLGGGGNADYQTQLQYFQNGYTPQTRLWIDDMYMINVLQTQAFRVTGDMKYVERAAREMVLYLDTIQNPDGLFYHTPETPFVWGRGDGWMAAGMPMILKYLPSDNEHYGRIRDGYLKMMSALLANQRESGLWGQLVTDRESWEETSCSAMFAFGFISGIKLGLLDESVYGPAARKAWIALCSRLDEHANLPDVCIGTGARDSREWYFGRPRVNGDPHGQAPLMWICNALVEK